MVRAAGTYFPQDGDLINSNGEAESASETVDQTEVGSSGCQRPFCKLKKKPHQHCDLCNQVNMKINHNYTRPLCLIGSPQAFTDEIKLKLHQLKHRKTPLGQAAAVAASISSLPSSSECSMSSSSLPKGHSPGPRGHSPGPAAVLAQQQVLSGKLPPTAAAVASETATMKLSPTVINQLIASPSFADSFSMQNLHIAHLAFYQQNPFYYQNLYPFLNSQGIAVHRDDMLEAALDQQKSMAVAAAAAAAVASAADSMQKPTKRTLDDSAGGSTGSDHNMFDDTTSTTGGIDDKPLPAKVPKRFSGSNVGNGGANNISIGGSFKIFKEEAIPQGYLKFRFNEDCAFANCGYRNHQSHFHCCRADCYYSFCDKTRFVQHTARHERLDKLMGDDFRQFRANMQCGYGDCAYNKNPGKFRKNSVDMSIYNKNFFDFSYAGQNNKSSHFHCLKCSFICSDTNKVVAHRRQHSKLEYIRQAGFRKVGNYESCILPSVAQSPTTATVPVSDSPSTATANDCTYSLKQTHYHCLVCNCSVLSRAQLSSHRHRV